MRLVICVSLRTAASAEAPLGPILFQERLPGGWAGAVSERAGACQWALTHNRTLWGGGALQLLDLRLLEDCGERGGALGSDVVVRDAVSEGQNGNGGRVGASTGVDREASTRGGGALERGHGAPLEPLAQLCDALCGVGALAIRIDAAELVEGQAAMGGGVSTGADTKANNRMGAAHLRFVICVSLRMAASAEVPLSPMSLPKRLQSMGEVRAVRDQACQWALTQERTLWGGGARERGDLRLLEDGSECEGVFVFDEVARETAKRRRGWGGERPGVSMGADRRANTTGRWRTRARSRSSP